MPATKVLIIEDDDVTALNLKMSLENFGYEVLSLANEEFSAQNKIKIAKTQTKRHRGEPCEIPCCAAE